MVIPRRISSVEVWPSSWPRPAPATLPAVGPVKPWPKLEIWLSCTPTLKTESSRALPKTRTRWRLTSSWKPT
jgi:hypothetical protein